MRKAIAGLLAVITAALLPVSCSPKSSTAANSSIVGKWQEIGGDNETLEFFNDGTLKAVSGGMSTPGKYSFLETNRMKVEFRGTGAPPGPTIVRFSMSGGELSLTDEQGEVSRYKKAP